MDKTTNNITFDNLKPALSCRTLILITAGAVVLMAGVLWLFARIYPLPPRTITMACGPVGSSYDVFAKHYKLLLAKDGIELKLVQTTGGVQNLAMLRDPKSGVDLGFVPGGIAQETDSTDLASLGTLGYEPLWFFSRKVSSDRGLFAFRGKKVSVGPEGSDSRALVDELSKRNGLDAKSFQLLGLSPEDSTTALLNGQIDAVIMVSSLASPVVRQLLKTPGIDLASFKRADAYVAIFPSLTKVVLPAGVVDLENNRPPRNTTLLATKTSLVIRGDMAPALQYLLVETAAQIHGRAGVFNKAGEFPAAEALEIPLSPIARTFYKSGRPFLQRYLPFWLAVLVEQLAVMMIPVIGLMYPLIKGLMALYSWGVQRKIFLVYGELHWLELQIDNLGDRRPTEAILNRMKHLEHRTYRIRVSSKYVPMLYSLKEAVQTVRARLDNLTASLRSSIEPRKL